MADCTTRGAAWGDITVTDLVRSMTSAIPIGLPLEYAVVSSDGSVNRRRPGVGETDTNRDTRCRAQEHVWNLVWKRRVIYFLTVFASLYLVVYPLYKVTFPSDELETPLRLVSDTIRLVTSFLPSTALRWINAYARDPGWFLVAAASVAILTVYGATLGEQITDRMRRVWNQALLGRLETASRESTRRNLGLGLRSIFLLVLFYVLFYPVFSNLGISWLLLPKDAHIGFYRYTAQPIRILISVYLFVNLIPEALVYSLRTLGLYQWLLRTIKLKLAPAIFAALTVWYVFALTSHYLFDLRDGFGSFCVDKPSPEILEVCSSGQPPTTSCAMQFDFDFSLPSRLPKDQRLCQPTGIQLERGKSYRVLVQRHSSSDGWTFWGEPSHIYGQSVADLEEAGHGSALSASPIVGSTVGKRDRAIRVDG
jgi:hypothetical protein